MRLGPLRSIADAYVPFQLFAVHIRNGPRQQKRLLAVDEYAGALDPYGFDAIPKPADLSQVETRNALPVRLDETQARSTVVERTRRQLYSEGFFKIRGLAISAEPVGLEFHVPYWIGFFGSGERAHLVVLDAVRRRFEGAKARTLFEEWLRA